MRASIVGRFDGHKNATLLIMKLETIMKQYDDRGPADLDGIFASDFELDWHMQGGERAALIYLLQRFSPQISIEIGTFLEAVYVRSRPTATRFIRSISIPTSTG